MRVETTVNALWNPLWKLVSRGCFSQKFATSSKSASLEEQSYIFSVKDLVHHHRHYHLGCKISRISENKLAVIEGKGKKIPFSSQTDGDHAEELMHFICPIPKPLDCNSATFFTQEYYKDKNGVYSCLTLEELVLGSRDRR